MGLYTALALAFAIGVLTGFRSLAAPAAVCWAAHWNWLHLQDSPLAFLGSTAALCIFTALALIELVVDKLPQAPDRRKIASLLNRIVMGGICGAALCVSGGQSLAVGALLGALGAVAGAYGGYEVRHRIVTSGKAPDFAIALLEDIIAVGGDFWIVSRF